MWALQMKSRGGFPKKFHSTSAVKTAQKMMNPQGKVYTWKNHYSFFLATSPGSIASWCIEREPVKDLATGGGDKCCDYLTGGALLHQFKWQVGHPRRMQSTIELSLLLTKVPAVPLACLGGFFFLFFVQQYGHFPVSWNFFCSMWVVVIYLGVESL